MVSYVLDSNGFNDSGPSGRIGDEKHEIYAVAFGSRLFMTYFYRAMFYPWVMFLLTVRITQAFGLPKPSDVASLSS